MLILLLAFSNLLFSGEINIFGSNERGFFVVFFFSLAVKHFLYLLNKYASRRLTELLFFHENLSAFVHQIPFG